ncbi:MAG: polysaccharide biosynthesis/export family protein [Hyphomicrobiaceae bacterium]|nr:polysaccharide biosynthesis/export family protein [Hyphomicrobiaceae bacterium]
MRPKRGEGNLIFPRIATGLLVTLICALLSGCGGFIPTTGPLSHEIGGTPKANDKQDYVVIDVDQSVIRAVNSKGAYGISRLQKTAHNAPKSKVGVGDVLSVTVYEAGESGLFSGKDQRYVTFPSLQVNQEGFISLPYAGMLKAVGQSPHDLQKQIVSRLEGRAIQPQAVVTIVNTESNTIVLAGDVEKPGRYPLSPAGDRLLDVVAKAGGSRFPAREVYVTFVRGQDRGTQTLERVVESQQENIFVLAGDRIYIKHDPKRYSVFGAIHKPGVYVFPASEVNVLEAMASAGGLIDERADATGLFVFRYEPMETVREVKPDVPSHFGPVVPTVYRISLRNPSTYFHARGFLLRDKDVVYVANSTAVEVAKVLRLIDLGTRSVGNIKSGVRSVD